MYGLWYSLHVICAYLSLAGFLLRGYWLFTGSPLRHARPVRILPHIIDTLLLVGAVGLVWVARQYPFVHGWVTVKVLALLLYIGLGLLAFRFAHGRAARAGAFAGAVLAFLYMLSVAYSRQPWPFG